MSCTTRARIEIKSDKKGEEIICSTQQRDADNTYISISSFPKGIYTAQRTTIMYTIVVLMRRVVDGRQRSDICARYLWSEINRHELKLQFFFLNTATPSHHQFGMHNHGSLYMYRKHTFLTDLYYYLFTHMNRFFLSIFFCVYI